MKIKFLFLFLIIIPGIAAFGQDKKVNENGYIVRKGDLAPVFKINEADGKSYSLSDLHGKVVMLQFTASWCSVCRKEMPFIEKEIWGPGKKSGLIVIGIDRGEPPETLKKFAQEMNITYPLALDPGADIFGLYALKEAGVTRNVIINRSGKIVFLTRLFDRDEFDRMKKIIFTELASK